MAGKRKLRRMRRNPHSAHSLDTRARAPMPDASLKESGSKRRGRRMRRKPHDALSTALNAHDLERLQNDPCVQDATAHVDKRGNLRMVTYFDPSRVRK